VIAREGDDPAWNGSLVFVGEDRPHWSQEVAQQCDPLWRAALTTVRPKLVTLSFRAHDFAL
jgi:hypothetical protein